MPAPVATDEQVSELNRRIHFAKEQVMAALRPFNNKFRNLVVGAALNDLDIEFPVGYSPSWALRDTREEG